VRAQAEQRAAEPNFEAVLQVVLGSAEATPAGTALPASLGNLAKQLRSNFSFAGYRVLNTYIGRVGNNGNLENSGMADIYGQAGESETPSFLDWHLRGVKSAQNTSGQSVIAVQSFRFGARVPVRTGSGRGAGDGTGSVMNYQPVGLNLERLTLMPNTPTLIGTISLPRTTGTAFVVLTLRTSDS
jgi:hypothetical protein